MVASTSKRYVIDASFLLSFLLPDERLPQITKIIEDFEKGTIDLYSSPLLPYEIHNGLKMATIRKRITPTQARELGKAILRWDIVYESPSFDSILALALEHNITVYDASYVLIAKTKHMHLLTLDKQLEQFVV